MKLNILIFHRVLAQSDPLLPDVPDRASFTRQMQVLKHCFRVLPLEDALLRMRDGRLPARAACITFDDGYADNLTVAVPILQRLGLHATFFIASDFLAGEAMWNDAVIAAIGHAPQRSLDLRCAGLGRVDVATLPQKREAIERALAALKYTPHTERTAIARQLLPRGLAPLMLNVGQLRALHAAGMGIGAHTASHPILAGLPDAQARQEIERGRACLEELVQQRVALFAYPNGKSGSDYDQRHVQMVSALGFIAAVTTHAQCANTASAPFELPRYTPWQTDRARFLLALIASRLV